MWASDFPHSDAKYPGVVDELREYTEGMDADAARRAVRHATPPRCTRCRPRRPWLISIVIRGGTVVDGTGAPRAHGRRRDRATGAIVEVGRVDARCGTRDDRRRRPARHARLRRHPHALRRAAALGPDRVAGVVARRHDADHRQLRLHARAEQARRRRVAVADAESRVEGMSADALRAGVDFARRRRSATSSPGSTAASASTSARTSGTARCAAT